MSWAMSGCLGSGSDTENDPIFSDGKSLPFTDAYIVYPGPNEKWVGPDTFTVHLSTIGPVDAHVTISSRILKSREMGRHSIRSSSHNLSIEAAREEIARLFASLKEHETVFHGCLSPVRVKLIRSDGALVERQACRGQSGWPKVASEVVNHLIESSVGSAEAAPRRLSNDSAPMGN